MTTWVVVADSSRGRIYVQDQPNTELRETEDLIHPRSRLHGGDLVSDRPSSDGGAVGQGRHVIDARTQPKEHEAETFAKEIAKHLERARLERKYQRLVLIAPPAFLGKLRENLDNKVLDLVVGQVDKNLVMHPVEELRQHLVQVL